MAKTTKNTKTSNTTETSDMEGQGIFTSRFNATGGQVRAQHCIELLEALHENVENFPEPTKLWSILDDMTLEERQNKIKTQSKRSKTRASKYKPKHLTKPKLPINLYRADYKKQVVADGGKFDTEAFNEAWHQLGDAEKEKYQAVYQKQMKVYEKDYAKAVEQAIHDGEYEAPKPKRPLAGYLLFTSLCRMEGNTIITKEQYDSIQGQGVAFCTAIFKPRYDELKENEDFMRQLKETQQDYRRLYEWQYAKWNIQRLEGAIRKCESEDKTTRYLQKELDNYKEDITFSLDEEPEVDTEWIKSVSTSTSVSSTEETTNVVSEEKPKKKKSSKPKKK